TSTTTARTRATSAAWSVLSRPAYCVFARNAGRDSTLLMVGERGYLIRDRIHVTGLNESPTMKELLPMMRNYRDILREVGRLMAPAGLRSPGAHFRFLGAVA